MKPGEEHREVLSIGEKTRQGQEVRSWVGRNGRRPAKFLFTRERERQRIAEALCAR